MKKYEYYFDFSEDALDYIMKSKILRNRDKRILKQLTEGKKTKEIAVESGYSYRTLCTRRKEIFEKTRYFM